MTGAIKRKYFVVVGNTDTGNCASIGIVIDYCADIMVTTPMRLVHMISHDTVKLDK